MKCANYRNLIFAAVLFGASAKSFAETVVSITVAPPALRVYVQPLCPAEGYIWAPGYWAYRDGAYVWAPGAWVLPPQPGLLFTPGYWDLVDGVYLWRHGHWGVHVGYYGGVNYGYGYPGAGFFGGRWEGGHFFYNREVSNVGERFRNTYREKVLDHGHRGASFHDRREDRHEDRANRRDGRRENRRADGKENREAHAREGAAHGGKAKEHTAKAAAHGGSKSGGKISHRG